MKTFKQWFNGLSEETQKYLSQNCNWIDKTGLSEDGYRHPVTEGFFEDAILNFQAEFKKDSSGDSDDVFQLGIFLSKKYKKKLDKETYLTLLQAFCRTSYGSMNNLDYLDVDEQREIVKRKHDNRVEANKTKDAWNKRDEAYTVFDKLLITEDFSNIDWSDTKITSNLTPEMTEILGHDKVYELVKNNPRAMDFKRGKDYELFDELFFCKDGWTKEQKRQYIHNLNYDFSDLEDFMRRIVAVDESYLREVGNYFIYSNPALAMYMYKDKKSQEEIDALPAKHKQEDEYRYPKEYRKLFQIAACCARKNVGKAMAGTIGDASCILKMYAYDFNKVFDCLYPQYAEQPEQTEEAQAV